MDTTKKIASFPIIMWGALYYLLGCLSLILDDPINLVSYIWLPAGVAVGAFLATVRAGWFRLFIILFVSRLLLDFSFSHPIVPSVLIAFISLGTDTCIAWCVRRFAKYNDEIRKTITWIFSTLILSTVSAIVGVNMLSLLEPSISVSFKTLWIWWSANVTGTIFITPALLGLYWTDETDKIRKTPLVVFYVSLIIISTSLIFLREWDKHDGIAIIYTLACLPIVLPVIAPVIFGNRIGALCFIIFSSIIMYSSWKEVGPLFMNALSTEESITLAQCYLSGAALLMVSIRVQNIVRFRSTEEPDMHEYSKSIGYTLNTNTGVISWNPYSTAEISAWLSNIKTKDQLLSLLPYEEERNHLNVRWESVVLNKQDNNAFRFRIKMESGKIALFEEKNLIYTVNQENVFIIGFWEQIKEKDYYTSPRGEF
ncbi:hypothetical protein L465_00422 [Enterobacter sp. BIDMC 29]|uniref:MASE1 domain-containing protein n=1 Tax=Enterobacter sp. BIDMC 29 TaxID=1329841 RepID=UPI000445E7BF|nr:MASE1 domain-containing protein [Enterobacter sp. BIDMC 29]EUM16608.1 hypothetical protein L465_00422 [Enterobacter sp. BIDMC 29]